MCILENVINIAPVYAELSRMRRTCRSLGSSGPHRSSQARQGKDNHSHCAESETAPKGDTDAQGYTREAESRLEPRPQSPFSRHVVTTYQVPGPVWGSRDMGMNQKSTQRLGCKAQQRAKNRQVINYVTVYNYIW